MMLPVRLPEELETEVNRLATVEHRSKSEIVKEALGMYVAQQKERRSSYEVGKDLFGQVSSGDQDRSSTYKSRLRRKLPMDLADASLIVAAEKLSMRLIISLDSNFYVYRTSEKQMITNIFAEREGR